MKRFFILFQLVLCTLFSTSALADFKGLISLQDGRKIFVDYKEPKKNKPTLVVVNGLTWNTKNWILFAAPLIQDGYGVFLYDAYGMGNTFLNNPIPSKPIHYLQQVKDLKEVLTLSKVNGPYNFLGLSYGGGILAAYAKEYPQDVKNLILIAPYTEFLESQKKIILQQIKMVRTMFPNNPATDDELTDYFIRQQVYTTYPVFEPSIMKNPLFLEGVVYMVQGIRTYQPIEDVAALPPRSVHLWIGAKDQYLPRDVLDRYWKAAGSAQASLTIVKYTEHKVPEVVPSFSARWAAKIMDGDPVLTEGQTFEGDPLMMKVVSEKGQEINLFKK